MMFRKKDRNIVKTKLRVTSVAMLAAIVISVFSPLMNVYAYDLESYPAHYDASGDIVTLDEYLKELKAKPAADKTKPIQQLITDLDEYDQNIKDYEVVKQGIEEAWTKNKFNNQNKNRIIEMSKEEDLTVNGNIIKKNTIKFYEWSKVNATQNSEYKIEINPTPKNTNQPQMTTIVFNSLKNSSGNEFPFYYCKLDQIKISIKTIKPLLEKGVDPKVAKDYINRCFEKSTHVSMDNINEIFKIIQKLMTGLQKIITESLLTNINFTQVKKEFNALEKEINKRKKKIEKEHESFAEIFKDPTALTDESQLAIKKIFSDPYSFQHFAFRVNQSDLNDTIKKSLEKYMGVNWSVDQYKKTIDLENQAKGIKVEETVVVVDCTQGGSNKFGKKNVRKICCGQELDSIKHPDQKGWSFYEYDVNVCEKNQERDSQRFIVAKDANKTVRSVYYTFNHYCTFVEIIGCLTPYYSGNDIYDEGFEEYIE